MRQKFSCKLILTFLTLLAFANSLCRDSAEIDGECTACGDLDFLLQGGCYPRIRGCMGYALPGPACTQCQSGYVLYQGSCVRQAVFNTLNNVANPTDIPAVVVDETPTLNFTQITTKVGEDYGKYFTDSNEQFLSSHPQLGKGSIKQLKKLQTKKGIYFIITYQSSLTPTQYEGLGMLNSVNETSQVYFRIIDNNQPRDPISADQQIRLSQGTKLSGFFLYEIRFDGTTFTFYYMDSNFYVYQAKFKQIDIGANLVTKMLLTSMTAADLAKQQLLIKYPELSVRSVLNVKKLQDFYSFTFDADTSASVRFVNFRFQVNKPIKTSLKMPGYDTYDILANFFDLFGLFNIFNPAYYACLNLANSEVPELKVALVISSTSSKISRGNGLYDQYFSISFSKLFGSSYQVYAVYTAENTAQLLLVQRKPDTVLYSSKYNYNADPLFFKGYLSACTTSQVLLIPSIFSVMMKLVASNIYYYKVTYSPLEFMEFRYNKGTGATELISYTVENQNILNILGAVGTTPEKTQPDLYLQYLKTRKSVDRGSGLAYFNFNPLNTVLSYVNYLGTYKANIGTSLATSISQLSNADCYDFSDVNKETADKVEKFVRKYYNLDGYTRQLIQGKVRKVGFHYRILFSNANLKQIQFKVEELYTLLNVIRTKVHNDGFEYAEPSATNADYQKVLQYLSSKENKIPLLTESTAKSVRGFYNSGKSTNKVVINKITGAAENSVFQTQALLPIPTELNFQNLLLPGTPSSADQANIQKLKTKAQATYSELAGAVVAYVDKILLTYRLVFKSVSKTYFICSGRIDSTGLVIVDGLAATSYKESDFSTCTSFDANGVCLNCPAATLEYQGSCWAKIQGCKVQAGKSCLRCAGPYILWDNKCKKSCVDCFAIL